MGLAAGNHEVVAGQDAAAQAGSRVASKFFLATTGNAGVNSGTVGPRPRGFCR